MSYNSIDPQLHAAIQQFSELFGGTSLDLNDLAAARAASSAMAEAALAAAPERGEVEIEDLTIEDVQRGIQVDIQTFRNSSASARQPAIIFIHGGGYVLGAANQAQPKLSEWCEQLGVFVVSVDYRLAPEHPFPAGLYDSFAALKWLSSSAESLNIDQERIAIVGESAGGGLAAGLALYARDHSDIRVALQLLIYPMIDHENIAPASDALADTYVWSRENNRFGWDAYLGSQPDPIMLKYAAPTSADDLSNLPPAYIPVGDQDLFLKENQDYAERLIQAGVDTTLKEYPGGFHAFAGIAPDADLSKQFDSDLKQALRQWLAIKTTE